jgi:diketogulonate reductase-like aldo/keto reductase
MKTVKLNNGMEMPVIGFGTWQTPSGEVAEQAVFDALEAGYRHIDTAAVYKNEKSVGDGIIRSGVKREDIFLTTKLWNDAHSYEGAKAAIDASLEKLQTDYLDLYLIHWPNPKSMRDSWALGNAEAWRAMEEAVELGKIRAIGVSNFHEHHLVELFKSAKIKPVVNQIYASPSDPQRELKAFNDAHDIVTQAYSPLGTGTILEDESLRSIAKIYNKSVAQVAIRWSVQRGYVPLPKSVTKSRIVENLDVFDFEISDRDMALIDTLKGIGKEAPDPDTKDF